jgi:F-type H+-transporting ATPase subunit delta
VKNVLIAKRYATALMLIGKEDGQAQVYREELARISELLDRETELAQIISNPLYDVASRRGVLETVIKKLNISMVLISFLILLFDKGRIGFIRNIDEYYQKLADELKGIARAELVSATDLSTEAVEKIRKSLSDMTGKEIVLNIRQDPHLIGGVVTKIGDLVLDGSVRTQLQNMKESLKRGERV